MRNLIVFSLFLVGLGACSNPNPAERVLEKRNLVKPPDLCADTPVFRIRIAKERTTAPRPGVVGPNLVRDMLILMVTQFVDRRVSDVETKNDPDSKTLDWLEVKCSAVAENFRPVLKTASTKNSSAEVVQGVRDSLKQGLHYTTRTLRHRDFPLPSNLQELEAATGFLNWPARTVRNSDVKLKSRTIYRGKWTGPVGASSEISISQTRDSQDGVEGVRETEVILQRDGRSKNFDFYVYGRDGRLTNTSLFKSGTGKEVPAPVPFTCLACHYNSESRAFQIAPSSFMGR